ncbi:MAG: aldose 1-epimerase family protein [Clostridia bacterium]|nr:aldose 1-epimerase family protein [Clostridia bacterium]
MVTIKNEHIEVTIDTLGAQMRSLKLDGKEYLWQGDKLYWGGQAPVLFPIVGGLRNNLTIIENRIYSMKRHGFARFSQFEIAKQNEESVTFFLKNSEETLAQYPYNFEFCVTYTVKGCTVTVDYDVKNTDSRILPFAIGGHPAIKCPINKGEAFEDYAVQFECAENSDCATVDMEKGLIDFNNRYKGLSGSDTINLEHKLFYQDAMIFDDLKSTSCKLYSKKSGNGVKMDFTGYDIFAIWSAVNDAPFVCLEPWVGCATTAQADDQFESKRGLIHLDPGGTCKKTFTLELF